MMRRKGKEITLEQKSTILARLSSGTSKAEISRLLNLYPSTVYKFCRRFSVRQCKENKPRSGRPFVVSVYVCVWGGGVTPYFQGLLKLTGENL